MLTTLVLLGVLIWITADSEPSIKTGPISGMEEFCRVECLHYTPTPLKRITLIEGPLTTELALFDLQTKHRGY